MPTSVIEGPGAPQRLAILFLVPVPSGVEAAGLYRPGSPERVGWGRAWVAANDSSTDEEAEGKMQSCCNCCLTPASNHRRGGTQVAPPASRHRGAVLVLCVVRTREAGEAHSEKRLAGGREVERSCCPGVELADWW